jgi:hypothetical protein
MGVFLVAPQLLLYVFACHMCIGGQSHPQASVIENSLKAALKIIRKVIKAAPKPKMEKRCVL